MFTNTYLRIFPRKALSVNLGKQADCIWQTETVGFDVTLWRTLPDGCNVPEMTKFCPTLAQAEAQGRKWLKGNE